MMCRTAAVPMGRRPPSVPFHRLRRRPKCRKADRLHRRSHHGQHLRFAAPRAKLRRQMAFTPNQRVRLNLAGLMIEGVTFHAAVTDALATVIRKTSEEPPAYLVELLFSFKGLKEIEVPEERIRPA